MIGISVDGRSEVGSNSRVISSEWIRSFPLRILHLLAHRLIAKICYLSTQSSEFIDKTITSDC